MLKQGNNIPLTESVFINMYTRAHQPISMESTIISVSQQSNRASQIDKLKVYMPF